MDSKDEPATHGEPTPAYLSHWPGLYIRVENTIVEAPASDVAVAKTYPMVRDKGRVTGGRRLTILTEKPRYRVNEEIRVLHVMEVVEPGHRMFIMGPKPIYGEYVDGVLATSNEAPEQIYDGPVLDSPDVDYNYDITSYRFSQPGLHRICWQLGDLHSNTLELEITSG